jgi:hypothetical protein
MMLRAFSQKPFLRFEPIKFAAAIVVAQRRNKGAFRLLARQRLIV